MPPGLLLCNSQTTCPFITICKCVTLPGSTCSPDSRCPGPQVYNSQAKPVEDFFKDDGLLRDFEISGGIPETLPRLLQELGPFSYLLAERRAQAARNQLAKQMTWVSEHTKKVMTAPTTNGHLKVATAAMSTSMSAAAER